MENTSIKETLEKQMQLLSERSVNAVDCNELAAITEAIIKTAEVLMQYAGNNFVPTYSDSNRHAVACYGENIRTTN